MLVADVWVDLDTLVAAEVEDIGAKWRVLLHSYAVPSSPMRTSTMSREDALNWLAKIHSHKEVTRG